MLKFFDLRHPIFRPLARRVAVVAISGGWALVELSGGNLFWALLFGGAAAYCAWVFFVVFDPQDYERSDDG